MADLKLRRGRGAFFLNGAELSYDSTPASTSWSEGGAIDFTARPASQQNLLTGNTAGDSVDISARTYAVIQSEIYTA